MMKLLYRSTYLDDDLSDDVFFPLACRLQRRGAFRNKERSKTVLRTDLLPAVVTTPLLPKLVHTDQAQNVSLALDMLPPLTVLPGDDPQHVDDDDPPPVEDDDPQPEPVDDDDPQPDPFDDPNLEDVYESHTTGTVPRTSSRLKKPNPKYYGELWD